ncbi:DUF6912 family protein [Streptomyces sp. 4N509B]|uniref:DUF6912 family protein n=1 Tax=Streptomyces sp. 4N509B TaxID=3457413 RepID=UPI003FD5050E
MRVYVPLTLPGLARLRRSGQVEPAPLTAYAVTPGLRAWYGADDQEELEYAALGAAGEASLRLLAAEPAAPRRRVVLAADVPDPTVRAEPGTGGAPGEVRLVEPVALRRAASVHVDGEDAEDDVAAAVAALAPADPGAEGTADTAGTPGGAALDRLPDGLRGAVAEHELLWYAVQEIEDLVRGRP